MRRIRLVPVLVVLLAACGGGEQHHPQPQTVPDLTVPDWGATELDPASYPDPESLQLAVHQFQADCFTANGFPSELQRDGSELGSTIKTVVLPEQEQRYADVSFACSQLQGPDGPPFNDAQISALYAAEVETAQCLIAAGISVEIPSEAAWRESGRQWSAYERVPAGAFETAPPIDERCPPPDVFSIIQNP